MHICDMTCTCGLIDKHGYKYHVTNGDMDRSQHWVPPAALGCSDLVISHFHLCDITHYMPPKKLVGCGFLTPYTLFCLICTIRCELKYFLIFTHLSERGWISAGFHGRVRHPLDSKKKIVRCDMTQQDSIMTLKYICLCVCICCWLCVCVCVCVCVYM